MMSPTSDYTRGRPAQWFIYVGVSDVDAYVARVGLLGGTLIEGPTDVPGVGRVCMIADPTGGAAILLMEPLAGSAPVARDASEGVSAVDGASTVP